MQQDALLDILSKIKGIERKAADYAVMGGWHLTLHLGKAGRALVVRKIRLIRFHGSIVEMVSDEAGTAFCECSDISVVVAQGDKEQAQQSRPGFG